MVLEETYSETQNITLENTEVENQDNKETMAISFSNTLKNLKNEEDEKE